MPRRPREEEAGAVHHVYARGVDKRLLYVDDEDRECYLDLLAWVVRKFSWRCLMYCLMGNHVHLVVETPEPNLGRGMHRLHGDYARHFNERHGRSGHVFQGRYENVRAKSDPQVLVATAYVALNPVEAGLVSLPADWRWSGHRAVIAGRAPAWLADWRLADYFSAWGGDGLARYAAFVDSRLPRHARESPDLGEAGS